jgi:hypothetical protein
MKSPWALLLFLGMPALMPGQASSAPAAPKLHASAIQIELIDVGDVSIPAEFRYAIYERLLERVRESNTFQKVFRSGDKAAKDVPDLVILHTTLEAFKEGSQTAREMVPVVAGTTKVDISAQVTGPDGKPILDRKIAAKVRLFGENLYVTNDVAKRITKMLHESF